MPSRALRLSVERAAVVELKDKFNKQNALAGIKTVMVGVGAVLVMRVFNKQNALAGIKTERDGAPFQRSCVSSINKMPSRALRHNVPWSRALLYCERSINKMPSRALRRC